MLIHSKCKEILIHSPIKKVLLKKIMGTYQRDKGANTKDSHKPKVRLFEPKRKTAM